MTMVIMYVIMKTIKASEFKAKCLSLMDDVAQSGEEIVVTRMGNLSPSSFQLKANRVRSTGYTGECGS